MLAGPATELIGNLLARPRAGGRITGPGTEECRQEKEKSTLLRIPGNKRERDMWAVVVVNSRQDQSRTGQKKSGAEYIVAFCYCGSWLGMSQHQDWHLNLVQY